MSRTATCAVLLAVAWLAGRAHASGPFPHIIPISSTVGESGYTGPQNLSAYPLTASPYVFTGQFFFGQPIAVESLTVTLTILDGDTAPGDFDFNNLYLALDGINTGLPLNGFPNGNVLTLTLTQIPVPLSDALAAALAVDQQWVGSVIDLTPNNAPAGDTIAFPSRIDTTVDAVVIIGAIPPLPVPLPAALLLAPPALAVAGFASRRFRSRRGGR